MFNSEAPYKLFSEKEHSVIQAMPFALYFIVYSSL